MDKNTFLDALLAGKDEEVAWSEAETAKTSFEHPFFQNVGKTPIRGVADRNAYLESLIRGEPHEVAYTKSMEAMSQHLAAQPYFGERPATAGADPQSIPAGLPIPPYIPPETRQAWSAFDQPENMADKVGFTQALKQEWLSEEGLKKLGLMSAAIPGVGIAGPLGVMNVTIQENKQILDALERLKNPEHDYSKPDYEWVGSSLGAFAKRQRTREEDEMMVANYIAAEAEKANREYTGWGELAANVSQSLPFMFQFVSTGGLSNITSGAARGVIDGAMKKLPPALAKGLSGTAGFAGEAAGRMAGFAPNVAGNVAESITRQETGQEKEKSLGRTIYQEAGDTGAEVVSEMAGGPFGKLLGKLPFASKVSALYRKIMDTPVGKFAQKGGMHGLPGEYLEEPTGTAIRSVLGTRDEDSDQPMMERIRNGIKQDIQQFVPTVSALFAQQVLTGGGGWALRSRRRQRFKNGMAEHAKVDLKMDEPTAQKFADAAVRVAENPQDPKAVEALEDVVQADVKAKYEAAVEKIKPQPKPKTEPAEAKPADQKAMEGELARLRSEIGAQLAGIDFETDTVQSAYGKLEDAGAVIADEIDQRDNPGKIKSLAEERQALKGKRGPEVTARRKQIDEEIRKLREQDEADNERISLIWTGESERIIEQARKQAMEQGLDEETADVVSENVITILSEPAGREQTWDMPIRDVIQAEIDEIKKSQEGTGTPTIAQEPSKAQTPPSVPPADEVKPAAPAAPAKEPWEMTKEEYDTVVSNKANIGYDDLVDPEHIEPPHEVDRPEALSKIEKRMSKEGWVGRPILVVDGVQGLSAVTGSHRIQAARNLGIKIPIIKLDAEKLNIWIDKDPDNYHRLFDEYGLPYASADRITESLREIGDTRAFKVFSGEIRANTYHESIVRKALSEGKPVPPEVLAEYPELKEKRPQYGASVIGSTDKPLPSADTGTIRQAEPPDTRKDDDDDEPTTDLPSQQGGFVGVGRPPATARVSGIVRDQPQLPPSVTAWLSRTKGYKLRGGRPGVLLGAFKGLYGFAKDFRYLSHIPRTADFAEIHEAFRYSQEIAKDATVWAKQKLQWALEPVSGVSAEAMARVRAVRLKLIADDMMEDIEKGVALPEGLTESDVQAMKDEADRLYETYSAVRESYDRFRQASREITDMLVAEGWLSEENAKEFYFPHKVIKYLRNEDAFWGMTRKPSEPRKGYLKHRKGGADYSTDVLERLFEHWAQVRRDVQMTRFLDTTLKTEQDKHFRRYLRDHNLTWKQGDPIPEGFRAVTVLPGRFYYKSHGVTEEMATALMTMDLDTIEGLLTTPDAGPQIRTLLAVGRKRQYIVREPIARQMQEMPTMAMVDPDSAMGKIYGAIRGFNTFIKRQILFNPLYAIPYHSTNFIGDAHRVAIALPKALATKHLVGYWKSMLQAKRGHRPELWDQAQRYGVIGAGWIGTDIPEIETLIPVVERAEISGAGKYLVHKLGNLFNLIRAPGQAREDWLRYATFAWLCEQADAGKNIERYAIKDLGVVKGLRDKHQKAAKIARDILGDYGAIGRSGVIMTDLVMPFYRWTHLNLPWLPRMIATYLRRGGIDRLFGAMLAAAAPYLAMLLWNYSDPDRRKVEQSLPYWRRFNFHLNDGTRAYYVNLPMDDFFNWLGIPENGLDYQRFQRGMIDKNELIGRILVNSYKEPGLQALNSIGGVARVGIDLTGWETYPEPKDYRVGWKRRGLNIAGDIFGAPGTLVEKAVLGGMKYDENGNLQISQGMKDTLNRAWMPVRPYTVDEESVYRQLESNTYKRNSKYGKRGEPHKGKTRKVESLRIQMEGIAEE